MQLFYNIILRAYFIAITKNFCIIMGAYYEDIMRSGGGAYREMKWSFSSWQKSTIPIPKHVVAMKKVH